MRSEQEIVDMPYFEKLMQSVDKNHVKWEISCHSDRDKKNVSHFCNRFGITAQTISL